VFLLVAALALSVFFPFFLSFFFSSLLIRWVNNIEIGVTGLWAAVFSFFFPPPPPSSPPFLSSPFPPLFSFDIEIGEKDE